VRVLLELKNARIHPVPTHCLERNGIVRAKDL